MRQTPSAGSKSSEKTDFPPPISSGEDRRSEKHKWGRISSRYHSESWLIPMDGITPPPAKPTAPFAGAKRSSNWIWTEIFGTVSAAGPAARHWIFSPCIHGGTNQNPVRKTKCTRWGWKWWIIASAAADSAASLGRTSGQGVLIHSVSARNGTEP